MLVQVQGAPSGLYLEGVDALSSTALQTFTAEKPACWWAKGSEQGHGDWQS